MSVFVILSLALLAAALGATVVAARHLGQTVRRLASVLQSALGRTAPLLEELQAEAAVSSIEVERLQSRVAETSLRGRRAGPTLQS